MKQKKNDQVALHEQAVSISTEIFHLITQYTHDSVTSKFFLPEEISSSFYIAAGGFASVIYSPPLEADDVDNSHALTFFLILITYGFQIYLRERSLRTKSKPYSLPSTLEIIEKTSLSVLEKAENGELVSSPLSDEVIEIALEKINKSTDINDFIFQPHKLNKKKLNSYMLVAMYYGYNFALQLIGE